MSLSRPLIIQLAACPKCCAMRGELCTFAPCDDPERKREAAGQSHRARGKLARKHYEVMEDLEL